MDRIATISIIDPDHHQPSAGRCPTDHQTRRAIWAFSLDATNVVKRLVNFRNRNVPFGMIGSEMLKVGGIPDDWPIVHPFSIYEMDGQIGVASGT